MLGDDSQVNLERLSVTQLLALSAAAVEELRRRGVVRTGNAPLGDYAEWLAWNALGGELAPNSERSFDLTTSRGRRVQVKSRRVGNPPQPGQVQSSPFRSWGFDDALFILLDQATFEVRRASLVAVKVVQDLSRYVPHVNGSYAYMTDDLMGHPEAEDLTNELRATVGDPPIEAVSVPVPRRTRGEPLRVNRQRRRRSADVELADVTPEETAEWGAFTRDVVEEFQSWRLEHGAGSRSAATYASGAKAFLDYCREGEPGPDGSTTSFADYLAEVRGLSAGTIVSYTAYARSFVAFLREREAAGPQQQGGDENVAID